MKYLIGIWLALAALVHAAGLEFEQLTKEVSPPPDSNTVTADYAFSNKGDKPVEITKADPPCSCLKVLISGGKLTYIPGESGVVRLIFDITAFSSTIEKVMPLYFDNAPTKSPSVQLKLTAHIPVLVAVDQKTVKWELGSKVESQTFHIVMAEGQTIHVKGITSSSAAFSCELKMLEYGRKYDLVVTPLEIHRPGLSTIRIETDCPIPRHKVQQVFAAVRRFTAAEKAEAAAK